MEPFILFLNLFVIANLLLITIALALKKESHLANICLILVIATCIDTCINNLTLAYFPNRFSHFTQIAFVGFNFCFGAVIFAYVTLLYNKKIPKYWFLHLLPCAFLFGLSFRSIFVSDQTILEELALIKQGEFILLNVANIFLLFHILIYLVLTKFKLRTYNKESNLSQEIAAKLKRKWAQDFLNYMILNTVVLISSSIISQVIFKQSFNFGDLVLVPLVSISVYGFIVYKNFQFSNVYEKAIIEKDMLSEKLYGKKENYNLSKLPNQEELKNKIECLMTEKRIFLDEDLSAQKLASELEISSNTLTQLLILEYNATFFDFLNKHKVEEAKKLLLNPDLQHYKVEAIGEMAGFSSRSSFFAVFKKNTGLSPSNYKSL